MNQNVKSEIWSWVKLIVSALVIAFILKTFIFQVALVNQISMEPTLHEGQILIISKLNYLLGNPQRGDIIVLKDNVEKKLLIKRTIGLPGETIEIKNDKAYINGSELNPDYTAEPTYDNGFLPTKLPDNKYFAMGDNRTHSRDSRSDTVGLIDRSNIVGKAVFRIWPLNKIGVIR